MRTELIALFGKHRSRELDISLLPRFMQDYLALTTQHTDAKPGLLLTAWLPFCAVNLGNRVYMVNNSTRIYPNIWSCVIGPSSISRKTTALRFGSYTIKPYEEELNTAPLKEYEERTLTITGTTLSKLMSYLAINPSRLFVHNELAGWLHEMNKSYNAGYKQTVTELYDNVDRTIANRERTERIIKPALSIASASTEGWLYKTMLDGAEQLGGFLQRMLFYVVRNINLEDVDLTAHPASDLESELAAFDTTYFQWWRALPPNQRLELSPEALELRDELYQERYRQYFAFQNDALMSYFTRIYDGYWFKFCILTTLAEWAERESGEWRVESGEALGSRFSSQGKDAVIPAQVSGFSSQSKDAVIPAQVSGFSSQSKDAVIPAQAGIQVFKESAQNQSPSKNYVGNSEKELDASLRWNDRAAQSGVTPFHPSTLSPSGPLALVSQATALAAFHLCDFYMENTIPLLEIMDEQDKLAGERKLVELIINKYCGKAPHSALLNSSHMKKRDFKECIETLLEREAITVQGYVSSKGNTGKKYILSPDIMDSWK